MRSRFRIMSKAAALPGRTGLLAGFSPKKDARRVARSMRRLPMNMKVKHK
jgi:hypothetical protein